MTAAVPHERPGGVALVREQAPPLTWVVMAYERAQATRLATGEQLRAVLQGRDTKWRGTQASISGEPEGDILLEDGAAVPQPDADAVDQLLDRIRCGAISGPVAVLGEAYMRYAAEEEALKHALRGLVEDHPTWAWLSRVSGIGHVVAARLVGRLRIERASTPSSFWAYCGLSTVPARRYVCATCGALLDVPATRVPSARHPTPTSKSTRRGTVWCDATPVAVEWAQGARELRVAPRPVTAGREGAYSPAAKNASYLVGLSLIRRGHHYKHYYREQRERVASHRPEWPLGRQFHAARRKTEKLFLAHLWLVWRDAVGLSPPSPDGPALGGVPQALPPWAMVDRK